MCDNSARHFGRYATQSERRQRQQKQTLISAKRGKDQLPLNEFGEFWTNLGGNVEFEIEFEGGVIRMALKNRGQGILL